jgi:hypothetical protein
MFQVVRMPRQAQVGRVLYAAKKFSRANMYLDASIAGAATGTSSDPENYPWQSSLLTAYRGHVVGFSTNNEREPSPELYQCV